eukprot:scaffold100048_cov35-Prasinocladus_malaysianus.AAC.1
MATPVAAHEQLGPTAQHILKYAVDSCPHSMHSGTLLAFVSAPCTYSRTSLIAGHHQKWLSRQERPDSREKTAFHSSYMMCKWVKI